MLCAFHCNKICGIKSLRMFTAPVRYIWWQPEGIPVDSLATRATAIHDNKIWKIVQEIRRDGIGGTCIIL